MNILIKAGLTSFGEQWQTAMSKVLGVNSRTVRRWASGETPLPAPLKKELLNHLSCRKCDMDKAMIEICGVRPKISINDIVFYQDKERAMSECLRNHRLSEFLDVEKSVANGERIYSGRVVVPHFATIEWHGLPFYAMKFDEIDSDKLISSEDLHGDAQWRLFEFDESEAAVVK